MADGSPKYSFVQLAGVDSTDLTYVLDTNVVSHVESMIRTADLSELTLQQQKAVDLAKVLADGSPASVVDDFALLEGSSFHNPDGLKASSVLIRDGAYSALCQSGGDLVGKVSSLKAFALPNGYDADVLKQLDATLAIATAGVIPAYCAALLLETRRKQGAIDRLKEDDVLAVLERLNTLFDYVPGTLWLTLLLACCGTQPARVAAMGVLKTGRTTKKNRTYEPGKNALSAAWDLGTLQSLSSHVASKRRLILVTEDKHLAELVKCIKFTGGALQASQEAFGKSDHDRELLERLHLAYAQVRTARLPQKPSRELAASAVQVVEEDAGVSSPLADALRHGLRLQDPSRGFSSDDLDAVVVAIDAVLAGDGQALITALRPDGAAEDLRRRLDAVLHLGLTVAWHTAERYGRDVVTVLRDGVQLLGGENTDGVWALVDLADRDARPLAASARYDLLSQPGRLKYCVMGMVGTVSRLATGWAPAEGPKANELVYAAASAIRADLF